MGCCLPSRVGAAGHGYTPINEPGASGTATLRAGRWSPISYGKKTWALAADGTLSRPAAYVHPVLWQMTADAEQDETVAETTMCASHAHRYRHCKFGVRSAVPDRFEDLKLPAADEHTTGQHMM